MRAYCMQIACLLLFCSLPCQCDRRYYTKESNMHQRFSSGWPWRVLRLMLEYYEDIARKTHALHDIRFSYEETAQYEIGYIMGEIVERYRKMVENIKRPQQVKSDAVFVTIKRVNIVQMLYFEIYHLVNMMHEIPIKHGLGEDMSKPSTTSAKPFDNKKAEAAKNKLVTDREAREKKKKQRLREMKKMRELMLKGQYHTERTLKPRNRWWPIDYGWEIDYYW